MPHVSKKHLGLRHIEQLQTELAKSLDRASDKGRLKNVLNSFLTRTERVMLSKRLTVIAMLKKGVSSHMIAESLSMSPSTTERMSRDYEKGKYDAVINDALGKKDMWELVEKILFVGGIMPPKVGGRRWRMFDKMVRKDKLRNS